MTKAQGDCCPQPFPQRAAMRKSFGIIALALTASCGSAKTEDAATVFRGSDAPPAVPASNSAPPEGFQPPNDPGSNLGAAAKRLKACRSDGKERLGLLQKNYAATVDMADGWVVVHLGVPVAPERAERIVQLYADADACASGETRKLEFQRSTGEVFARADGLHGIRMTQ